MTINDLKNYSTSICPFKSGKRRKQGKNLHKFQYHEWGKSFLEKIKNICHNVWGFIIW